MLEVDWYVTSQPVEELETRPVLPQVLDGVEAVATTIYIVLTAVVAIGVLAALRDLVLNRRHSFGNHGEWFYVGLVFLLVIGGVLGHVSRLLKRRAEASASSRITAPTIQSSPSGFPLEWSPSGCAGDQSVDAQTFTWSFDMAQLSGFDQSLYRRPLQLAVDATPDTSQ